MEKALKELEIPEEVFLKIVGCFLRESGDLLKLLEAAAGQNDFKEISRIGHQIKGAAGNIRLGEIQSAGLIIENMAERGNSDGLGPEIKRLDVLLDHLRRFVKEKERMSY